MKTKSKTPPTTIARRPPPYARLIHGFCAWKFMAKMFCVVPPYIPHHHWSVYPPARILRINNRVIWSLNLDSLTNQPNQCNWLGRYTQNKCGGEKPSCFKIMRMPLIRPAGIGQKGNEQHLYSSAYEWNKWWTII